MCECVFLVKQKTAYELRISDWSSDVCSSDLGEIAPAQTVIVLAARFQEAECYSALNLCFARPGVGIVVGRHPRWIGPRCQRSDARRVGKEWGSPCSLRWWTYPEQKTKNEQQR